MFLACGAQELGSELKVRNGDPLPNNYDLVVKAVKADGTACVVTALDDYHLITAASCLTGDASEWTINGVPLKSIEIDAGYTPDQPSIDLARITTIKPVVAPWYASTLAGYLPYRVEGLAVGYGQELNTANGDRNTGRMTFRGYTCIYDKATDECAWRGMLWTAGVKDQMVCKGDEGSPIFVNGKLAGVLSFTHWSTECIDVQHAHYTSVK